MKLIFFTAFVIKYTIGASEHYPFPPQFHKPNHPGHYGSESSIFLPPESYTPVPHFPMKNVNNIPFPYLPPTGTKAPSMFPSPFPVILSSTLVPIFDDDEDDEKDSDPKNNKFHISSPMPPPIKHNVTANGHPRAQLPAKREMKPTPKMGNYHNPIDRIDMRFQPQFPLGPTTPSPINQSPRNMIIDTHRNDFGIDQIKSPFAQNPHYVPAPGFSILPTTEPAIPIIRLSNEMDLDGSFSYEALGADQTHYVQHSHMENMGTDKQEQVVEGSYSYVGDNGQTYTVHYIADSNGFRASGDHLPVAPPIPEIIQRAVQYNLAEEAKKPPHLREWQEQNENDYHSGNIGQPFLAPPPTRNLFTGRTPEAFSYTYLQGSNNDNNNLATAASSQVSVKTNPGFIIDQTRSKVNNGPIAPQITFVASQGAHVPSVNQQTQQESISRIFNSEKATMPQLVNYESNNNNKDSEQEQNKSLWRWQYGQNSNNLSQTPDKNTISRSFGEGDDIMINFGDMTHEQYTKMLQSQLEPNPKNNDAVVPHYAENQNVQYKSQNSQENNNRPSYDGISINQNYPRVSYYSTVTNNIENEPSTTPFTTTSMSYYTSSTTQQPVPKDIYSSMTSEHQQTNLYGNLETPYEFRRIKTLNSGSNGKPNVHNMNVIPIMNSNKATHNYWNNKMSYEIEDSTPSPKPVYFSTESPPNIVATSNSNIMTIHSHKSEFKPITHSSELEKLELTTKVPVIETTTENIFQSNLFLRNLIKPIINESTTVNQKLVEDSKKVLPNKAIEEQKPIQNKYVAETKADKISKFYQYQPKPMTDLKNLNKKRPFELSDVLSYITNKNSFESSKVSPKSSSLNYNSYEPKTDMRTILKNDKNSEPFEYNDDQDEIEYKVRHQTPKLRNMNHQEQEELRGIIKNYKVLQRNNNIRNFEQNGYSNRKEVTPPSIRMLQSAGLPPLGRAGPSMKTYLPPIYV